ncbi:MAG: cardiolipin synthase [Lachnospiraceae bacterium]|nr:cardiolipin synthase [Lachnospiraceae bacterium]MCI9657534.1 cardiolipin synthase [Lachnospiraceae bacterium]
MKKLFRLFKSRLVLVGLAILLQVFWWALFMSRLTSYSVFFNVFFQLISIGILLYLIRKDENSAYKIAWIILVMGVPLFGGVLYLMVGNKKPSKRLAVKMAAVKMEMKEALSQNQWILKEIRAQDPAVAGNLHYIGEFGAYPVWKNTEVSYFSVGEQMFASMLEDLRKAEHYIFLEYFIIQEGLMWDWILEILEQKVKEGVDVRLIYDDVGCVSLLPVHYANIMEQKGIKCLAFNRFVPFVSLVMNNRDHRKIMVIDGHTAYNGGINLADEYINKKLRFGHWKDTGVRLHGDAVFNFTLMFLEVWNAFRSPDLDYEIFRPHRWHPEHFTGSGYVAPYADTPLDNESLGENVYINILNQAKEYVYIATPYLLISDEMENALCLAAKRGVDVRILMPGIPDKPMVFFMAKSYYPPLLKAGVQIYEYTPGFVHAKSYVCDDRIATVGTINMDFRSLYLHFECGTFLYDCSAVLDVKKDMEDCFPKCHQVSIGDCRQGMVGNMITSVLRVLAPLM